MRVHKIVIETHDAPRGARTWFPVPQLGALCICCDAPGRPVDYDPAGDRQRADKIAVPVCEACTSHVARGHRGRVFLCGLTGGLGLMLLFYAAVLGAPRLALLGVLLIAVVVAAVAIDHERKHVAARRGHHRDFLVAVGAGFSVVRTTNPRLAAELCARHGSAARALSRS